MTDPKLAPLKSIVVKIETDRGRLEAPIGLSYLNLTKGLWQVCVESILVCEPTSTPMPISISSNIVVGNLIVVPEGENVGLERRTQVVLAQIQTEKSSSPARVYHSERQNWFEVNDIHEDVELKLDTRDATGITPFHPASQVTLMFRRKR